MAKLRHVVLATRDPDRTADFYRQAFEFEEVGRYDTEIATGVFLSDGTLNLAVLKFHDDQTGRGADYVGLHHVGFLVEDTAEVGRRLEALGAVCIMGRPEQAGNFFEMKYRGPDGLVFDIAQHPWVGAAGLRSEEPTKDSS